MASARWDGKFHVWDVRLDVGSLSQGKKNALATTVDLPGKALGLDVASAGGVTRAVVSTSGECNVFDDLSAASSSISTADKENNKEGWGSGYGGRAPVPRVIPEGRRMAQVPWLSQDGVLAATSVVVIARIIDKMCKLCADKTCLVLLIIYSLTPPPQSSTLS